jgi:hypothetical protein
MVAHRLSPSGPFITTDRLRFYGADPGDNVAEQTGVFTRAENDFSDAPDPATELEDVEDAGYAVQPEPYTIGTLVVQRLVGESTGATDPAGDGDITIQVQRYNPDTSSQENIGAAVTFGPAEFGKKVVQIGGLIPVDEFVFVRATYPENWVQGDKGVLIFVVGDLIA